jgi:hypothetical protein
LASKAGDLSTRKTEPVLVETGRGDQGHIFSNGLCRLSSSYLLYRCYQFWARLETVARGRQSGFAKAATGTNLACFSRAGIEATLSQAVRRCGLRRARYDGLAKVQHLCTAVAVNLVHLDAWFTQTPVGQTRISHFARLAHLLSSSA